MTDKLTIPRLIVGLGNPGQQYEKTRHNAGFWFLDALAKKYHCSTKHESKYHGIYGKTLIADKDCYLLAPTTFMNLSGQATQALASFFKINTEEILVVHDELDLSPGTARLKVGGGHGGHNGLRDIIQKHSNNKNFMRLRIGIGHPGHKDQVTPYVLGKAPQNEQLLIDNAIEQAINIIPELMYGNFDKATQTLHRFKASA